MTGFHYPSTRAVLLRAVLTGAFPLAEWYEVREGSPVEVQWAVGGWEDDLWWEGFVEQVSFKSGMEERGEDKAVRSPTPEHLRWALCATYI